ncbi:helix-turn-helix transcriptional regulator [Cohnella rhizosphaerae]|uniref:Helix-turn-helix transcriptional regulator n=1 Tax=Cohnella rhizosphaerae TaxID=1457232 RepID=A0A9X4KZ10_9BACL|nr:helix-turn-helix transcriptional regulator [Cohnella rhizosphaerae]MDG0813966.1 helix-turn-helix transcriptional regulator [Cohnella rhizosphaerae]
MGSNFDFFADLTSLLSGIQSFEMGVSDVVLVNLDKAWLIDNQSMIRLSEAQNTQRFQDYASRSESSFWVSEGSVGGEGIGKLRPSMVRLVKKFPIYSRKPSIIVEAQIPDYQMQKWLSLAGGDGGILMIADRQGSILTASGPVAGLEGTLPANWLSEMRGASNAGLFHAELGGRQVVCIYRESAYNGWRYVSVSYVQTMTQDVRTIGWTTFALCLGILLVTGALAIALSRNMYSPIRRLYNLSTGGGRDLRDHSDELLTVGNRLTALMQTESDLRDRTARQQSQLRDYTVFRLLTGHMKRSDWEELAKYITPPEAATFFIVSVQIDSLLRTKYEPNDFDLLMFAVQNIVGELLAEDQAFPPICMERAVTAVLKLETGSLTFKERASGIVERIQRAVLQFLQLSVSVGISSEYGGLSDMAAAYRESTFALQDPINFGEGRVLFFQDVMPARAEVRPYPDNLELELIESIENRDPASADSTLHELVSDIYKANSVREIQFALVRLLIDIMKLAPHQWGMLQGHDTKTTFERLFELDGQEEVEVWFRSSIIGPILKDMSERSEQQVTKISNAMLQMIHEGFDTELTLEVCSKKLNYHADYLRRVFKKGTGINYSDYLAQYRLSMAKDWLMNTDMKIAEIAEKLKYHSPQNFIRYFKKDGGNNARPISGQSSRRITRRPSNPCRFGFFLCIPRYVSSWFLSVQEGPQMNIGLASAGLVQL